VRVRVIAAVGHPDPPTGGTGDSSLAVDRG
jgi:hypothetical protein